MVAAPARARSFPSSWKTDATRPNAYRVEDFQVLSQKIFATAYFSYLERRLSRRHGRVGLHQQAYLDADGVWQNSYAFLERPHAAAAPGGSDRRRASSTRGM